MHKGRDLNEEISRLASSRKDIFFHDSKKVLLSLFFQMSYLFQAVLEICHSFGDESMKFFFIRFFIEELPIGVEAFCRIS